jgi:hypothetical protein
VSSRENGQPRFTLPRISIVYKHVPSLSSEKYALRTVEGDIPSRTGDALAAQNTDATLVAASVRLVRQRIDSRDSTTDQTLPEHLFRMYSSRSLGASMVYDNGCSENGRAIGNTIKHDVVEKSWSISQTHTETS